MLFFLTTSPLQLAEANVSQLPFFARGGFFSPPPSFESGGGVFFPLENYGEMFVVLKVVRQPIEKRQSFEDPPLRGGSDTGGETQGDDLLVAPPKNSPAGPLSAVIPQKVPFPGT